MADEGARRELSPHAIAMLIPLAFGALLAVPVLAVDEPPMTDFAAHEAIVHVLRSLHDAARCPPGLYTLNLGHPNQLFYLLAWALSFVLGPALACRAVVALSLMAILAAAGRLARHTGASAWATLLVAPLALGWTFYLGFVANLLGLACLLASIPTLDRFAERPAARGALACSAWMVVQYSCHEALLFVAFGFILLLTALRAPRTRAALWSLVPLAVAVALVVAQAIAQEPLRSRANLALPLRFVSLPFKLGYLPYLLFGQAHELRSHAPIAVAFAAIFVVFAVRRSPRAERGATGGLSMRAYLERHRFVVLGLACVALFLAMPADLNGATYIYERYLPPAAAILLIALSPARERMPWFGKALAAAVPLLVVASALPQFVRSSRVSGDLDELLPLIEDGSAVANLDVNSDPGGFYFHPSMMSARVVSAHGGRVLLSFLDSPISPALIAKAYGWPELVMRNNRHATLFRPSFDLLRFKYALLYNTDPTVALAAPAVFAPEAELIGRHGDWMLFRSTILKYPPASPELPAPDPAPETLGVRLRRLGFSGFPDEAETSGAAASGAGLRVGTRDRAG